MPGPSDLGGRPVTTCPRCQTASVKAVSVASNFVYLRCSACAFLFAIEDRRSGVRPDKGRIFR
jgi:transcription elongation factor Elf1